MGARLPGSFREVRYMGYARDFVGLRKQLCVPTCKEGDMSDRRYRALVSSDWSECLSPNGPFDPLSFVYPELKESLGAIFTQYTGNTITLAEAVKRIETLLPEQLSTQQMDMYLDAHFTTYTNVPKLIQWCLDRNILFMINTTGTYGYFERAIAKGLIPHVPVIAANPMLRFDDSECVYAIHEIEDKPKNTEKVLRSMQILPEKLVVMGDSGGDGPHFQWAWNIGGHCIGSMAKASLTNYCRSKGTGVNTYFGLRYEQGEPRNVEEELKVDFMQLTDVLTHILGEVS